MASESEGDAEWVPGNLVCPEWPEEPREGPGAWAGTLTTCSLIWMHSDFFLTAAMPIVKVFRMLVARRSASCEPPSKPAMEPDSTVALPARPRNRLLMIFLPEVEGRRRERSHFDRLLEGVLPVPRTTPNPSYCHGQGPGLSGLGLHAPHPREKLQGNLQTGRRVNQCGAQGAEVRPSLLHHQGGQRSRVPGQIEPNTPYHTT